MIKVIIIGVLILVCLVALRVAFSRLVDRRHQGEAARYAKSIRRGKVTGRRGHQGPRLHKTGAKRHPGQYARGDEYHGGQHAKAARKGRECPVCHMNLEKIHDQTGGRLK